MKWINALGLLLQFLAFWFAAPELIGEQNLKRLKKGLIRFISTIPLIVFTLIILAYGGYFTVGGIIKGMQAADDGSTHADIMQSLLSLKYSPILILILILILL